MTSFVTTPVSPNHRLPADAVATQQQQQQHQQPSPLNTKLIETCSESGNDPAKLACLALSMLQAHAYGALSILSSPQLKDRINLLDSDHYEEDKLYLYSWPGILKGGAAQEAARQRQLMFMRAYLEQFQPNDHPFPTVRFRRWDKETLQAAVFFMCDSAPRQFMQVHSFQPPHTPPHTPVQAAEDSTGHSINIDSFAQSTTLVVIVQKAFEGWHYHDVRLISNWDEEYSPSTWHETVAHAQHHFEELSTLVPATDEESDSPHTKGALQSVGVTAQEDQEYWDHYDVVFGDKSSKQQQQSSANKRAHISKPSTGSSGQEAMDVDKNLEEEEEDDDYWDDYDQTAARY